MQIILKHYIFLIFCIIPTIEAKNLVVIDPAGNAQNPGRKLSDTFERGTTLQCAEAIKNALKTYNNIEVVCTRTTGSTNTQEQNAQMANRLNADLFIHLSFFQETEVKPRLFLYTFSYDNDFPIKTNTFFLCPYDQAHCIALEKTTNYINKIYKTLTICPYAVQKPIGVPYLPLKGIMIPAIGIEIGLHTTRDWRECVDYIVQSIKDLLP